VIVECTQVERLRHKNMRILVTGATGFIGKALVKKLSESSSHDIICLVRNPHKAESLKPLGVKLIYADITEKGSLNKILDYEVDVIFHCAGCVKNKNPDLLHKVNVLGTENICELAKGLKAKRFIYISSVAVVSGNPQVPLKEDLPFSATNIYGQSKIEAEKIVLQYRQKDLPVVIIRPPMVYGEAEPHMLKLLVFLIKRRWLPLINEGKSKFHLAYVKNVVDFMIFALDNDECLKESFFVADKEVFNVAEVFSIIGQAVGAKKPIKLSKFLGGLLLKLPHIGKKVGFFLKDRVYSIERAESLGFSPGYSAEENLTKSARSFLKG